jgi:hypothetical protein
VNRPSHAKEWLGKVKASACVVCSHMGMNQSGPTFAHHPHAGMSNRGGDFTTAALCYEHHQGATGIHGLGTKGFYNRYRLNEMDLADMTVEAVYRKLRS